MQTWLAIWTWTLILGVALFACLSVAVIIGGASDIKAMFRSIAEQHESRDDTPPEG